MQESLSASSVLVDSSAPVAALTLNRPAKRNALSLDLMHELTAALHSVAAAHAVRAIVIKARGPVFSSGHDLAEFPGRDLTFYRELFDACVELMETIQAVPQPVIAQVQGVATAAGCQLVATCDLAVASESATFATPGIKIGLFCSTPMVALSRVVPSKIAMQMLLTGDPISAQQALAAGLINAVVPADALDAATADLAARVVRFSAYVTGLGKQAFYRQREMPQHEAYGYTKDVMSRNADADAAREGIAAFLEKRPPKW
ncbi:MAG TPA: enoyl-CoA hydratase [Candidatus Eremiobacteraceae bacterium]|nr:enoyl-CoA hydratase [Candidatus Eremiobacteraceae bacterium]